MVYKLLFSLFGAIVPGMHETPEVQYMWRLKIAALLTATAACVPLMVMASTGHLWGFTGFVPKADFESYLSEARLLRAQRLRVDLLALQYSRCKAPTEEARRLYTLNLDQLQYDYFKLTGQTYNPIDCSYL